MIDRIKKIMEYEGMTPAHFADYIEIGRAVMSHILNGRNKPSLEVITKILNKIDYIDSNWLLTGEGNMLIENNNTKQPNSVINDGQYITRDLFSTDKPSEKEVFPPTTQDTNIYRKEIEINRQISMDQIATNQQIRTEKKEEKNISKIIIYYSDNTFETFCPEKNESQKK